MEKMMSGYLINIGELAFSLGLKNIVAFLPVYLLAVFFSIKDDFNRDGVKSLAFAPFNKMGTLLALKRHRFSIVYKMRHFVLQIKQPQKYDYFLNCKGFE